MAKRGSGYDLHDAGNVAKAPSSDSMGVPAMPAKTTMGEAEVRKDVARNPKGG